MKDKQNAFAALGSYVHKCLETYLNTGRMPSGGEIALEIEKKGGEVVQYTHDQIAEIMLPGLKYLPAPGTGKTEVYFELDLGDLGIMVGYVDLLYDENGKPIVTDHKTSGNLRWALKPKELEEGPQGVVYSVYAMEAFGADEAECRWVYYQTKKPRSKQVCAKMSLTKTAKLWQGILEDVKEMKALRGEEDLAKVPYDATACEKYGGCPYANEICRLTPAERLRSYTAMVSLREKMEARKVKAQAASEPKPEPTVESAPPAEGINPPEKAMTAVEKLKAKATGQAKKTQAAPAKPAPAKSAGAPVTDAPPPKAEGAPPAHEAPPPSVTPVAGFALYIDCAPNTPCIDFAELIQPVMDKIKAEHGTHYRLVDGLYGGNGALFAEALAQHLDTNPPTQGVMATLASPVVRDGLEVLVSRATLVVRGF